MGALPGARLTSQPGSPPSWRQRWPNGCSLPFSPTLIAPKCAESIPMPDLSENITAAGAYDPRFTFLTEGAVEKITEQLISVAGVLAEDVHMRQTASRESLYKAISSIYAVTQQLHDLPVEYHEVFLAQLPRQGRVKSINIEYRVCMGLFDLPTSTARRRTNTQKQISDYAKVLEQASYEGLSPKGLLLQLTTRNNGIRAMSTRASARRAEERASKAEVDLDVTHDNASPPKPEAPALASEDATQAPAAQGGSTLRA